MSTIRLLIGSSGAPRAFITAAVVYLLTWILVPPLIITSLPLDVVEGISWGRDWQWGYYKHPPFPSWVLSVFYGAFGNVGPYLLSQLCIVLALWLVWLTGCRLTSPERSFLGVVLTMGVVHYSRSTVEFNHNVAQIPVWAALGYCLLAALQDGRRWQWLLLGVVAGIGMLTKYSVGFLLLCQALYLVLSSERRVFLKPGPWLALGAMLVVLAPHVYWLWQSNWLPMEYVGARASGEQTHTRMEVLIFPAVQVLNHFPLILIVSGALLLTRRARKSLPAKRADWRLSVERPGYLLTIGLGPCLVVTLLGVLASLRVYDMWGTPMWVFSGLLVVAWLPQAWLAPLRPKLLAGLLIWLLVVSVVSGVYLAYSAQWRDRPARTDWPMAALAEKADTSWNKVASCRFRTVGGDDWLAGLIVADSSARPSLLIEGDPRYSPWVTLENLKTNGLLWVWQEGEAGQSTPPAPPELLNKLPVDADMRKFEGEWQLTWPFNPARTPLTVHWRAYVPEGCVRAGVS
ncbi:glycosyltransferase family 39 protein [Ottowia thiooxydans]|uniref:glycosyltransferase family 39 protein n=1 Tax=Ottowia thiooxydans TaxID=219182 RepID=UPI00041D5327|nr:glycosyltransferase family 39 protein [Ottowia thiooxydans]